MCEGWSQVEFIFKPQLEGDDFDKLAVKLHLSVDKYIGEVMMRVEDAHFDGVMFNAFRMLPPGNNYYYYTVDGSPMLSDQHP